MSTFFTVFFQMLSLLLMIGAGFFITKKGMLDSHTNEKMSGMIVKVFNPLLIISSAEKAIGQVSNATLLLVALIACGMFAFFILGGMCLTPLFEKDRSRRSVFQMLFVFSNLGFIGIPVVQNILGAEYVVYVTVFLLVYNVVFYSYGVALLEGKFNFSSLKSLLNPGMCASVISLLLILFNVSLPNFINTAVSYLAGVTSPMALIAVGHSIANASLKKIFGDVKIFIFAIVKNLVFPLLMLPLLLLVTRDNTLLSVCMVMFGMPVGNLPLILATQKGIDTSSCSASIIVTTVLCVVTIPILMSVLSFAGGKL